jgi:hypothetical protein
MNSQLRDEAFQQLYDRGMVNVSLVTSGNLLSLGICCMQSQLTDHRQRRKVMGDTYVDKALAGGVSEFSRPAQEYVTRNAWDGIWGRDGLEFKHRSLVVIR